MTDQTSSPWTGNFNVRGAALTFTNKDGKAFVYYFGLMDFPSSYQPYNGVDIQYNSVTAIDNPGTLNYDPNVQYTALNHDLVYYGTSYYYCIADTTGPFNPSSWQSAGGTSYQLNFSFVECEGWPGGAPGDTTYTTALPYFTTDSNYDPSTGPIVNISVTNDQYPPTSSDYAKNGNPNQGRPPVVNLPLKENAGVPATIIFSSATYYGDWDSWVMACVNTGLNVPGYFNKIPNSVGEGGPGENYACLLVTNPAQTHPVAAVSSFNISRVLAPGALWPTFTINYPGQQPSTIYNPIPNPLSAVDPNQMQYYFVL